MFTRIVLIGSIAHQLEKNRDIPHLHYSGSHSPNYNHRHRSDSSKVKRLVIWYSLLETLRLSATIVFFWFLGTLLFDCREIERVENGPHRDYDAFWKYLESFENFHILSVWQQQVWIFLIAVLFLPPLIFSIYLIYSQLSKTMDYFQIRYWNTVHLVIFLAALTLHVVLICFYFVYFTNDTYRVVKSLNNFLTFHYFWNVFTMRIVSKILNILDPQRKRPDTIIEA